MIEQFKNRYTPSLMQLLLENASEVITIYEEDESIRFISPSVEPILGYGQKEMIGKSDIEKVHPDHRATFSDIFVHMKENPDEKITVQYAYKAKDGHYIWIESTGSNGMSNPAIHGYILNSRDITERRKAEQEQRMRSKLEIQNKNKKITESINYAKRIQTAILPNTRLINRALPDSFILYKPRDVISGDFPWFVQLKNEILLAAVDCTGHGVPGAMLSLIGYFLLNDIVRSRKVTEPGKILDLLDEGVTTTLRQDEDASTKDGMDISLCKINLADREVEYAGAHRPLYIMKEGEMEEIKGNKFPIGGGIFKNQTNFTNTKIKLGKGDSIYYCSDGFSDQFGGPEGRKFGPKKMRELIENIHTLPMKEAMKVFEERWETWKGNQKQTDDVLLIGIKF